MAIRKSNDISNDPNINSRLKTPVAKDDILERYNVTKTDNILPCDDGLAYLSEKVDECIDVINTNETKTGITDAQAAAITANTAKTGITSRQAAEITANNDKAGISTSQANAITANTAKVSMTFGTSSSTALRGDTTVISSDQASAITANTAKTGISSSQASAITANTAKVGTETDLSVTSELTVLATVSESRGVYTLRFTMRTADGRTTKTADITMR